MTDRARLKNRTSLRVSLEPRGRALLAAGVACILLAYMLPRSELLYAGTLLLSMPLIALVTVRFRRRRMSVSRRFIPAVASVGNTVTVMAEVCNLAGSSSGESAWRDSWPWPPLSTQRRRLAPLARHSGGLGRGGVTTVTYVMDPPRRGIFEIGPLVLDVGDPFRVCRGEVVVGGVQSLIVTPRVAELPATLPTVAADEGSARALQRLFSAGGDDIMTRGYRHGDPLRRVHWKASARHDELMVREEEQRSHAQARIVLDTRRAGYRDTGPAASDEPESDCFEWAVAFTASLALHLQHIGFTVEVQETGYRQLASPDQRDDFLTSLAAVTLVEGAAQRMTPPIPAVRSSSRGSVFALLADAEPLTVERLVAERGQFGRALAFIINPHNDVVAGRLRDAGWTCMPVRPTDDMIAVWSAAAEAGEAQSGQL